MVVFFRERMKRLKIIVLPEVTIYIIKLPYKKGRLNGRCPNEKNNSTMLLLKIQTILSFQSTLMVLLLI